MKPAAVSDPHPKSPASSRRGFWLRSILLPALFGASATSALLFVPLAGWSTNDVTTGLHPGYPDLQPRAYDSSPYNTMQLAAAAATGLNGWKVIRRDASKGVVSAEVRSMVPFFTEDITVTVSPSGPGGRSSRVSIQSRSRFGPGDLGANARHIRALQAEMDDKLPRLD